MAIWHEEIENCFVIHIEEPDLTEAILDRLRQVLTVAFLNQQYDIIFDLSACSLVDSFFIGFLITTFREVRELKGRIICAGVDGQVQHAFSVIHLNQVIEIVDTVKDAVERFYQPSDGEDS